MQRLVAQQLETMMESRTAESYAEEAAELRRNLRDARAERDVLRRDAERYRWLRDNPWPPILEADIKMHRNARWDAKIDAAMAAVGAA